MRFLFIHQNFPGQFRHVAGALAQRGHDVIALGINKPAGTIPGVRYIRYRPDSVPPLDAAHPQARGLLDWAAKLARGQAAMQAMRRLRVQGFEPDVLMAHPGWGEALFAKDVFPRARLLVYAEFFYGTTDGDSNFDPEFPEPLEGAAEHLRLKNTHLLHALSACDAAISPTEFQKSRHPAWVQDRIQVIHDGIDTERFQPNPTASVKLRSAGLTLRPSDEVVTFAVRRLEPYRGYHVLMRALPLLQRLRPNAHVVIVGGEGTSYGAAPPAGKTWRNIFLSEVAACLDRRRVHFVGFLPHHLLTQVMQISAAHIYLTYPFVLSWSMLEAMSVGCLVIGSNTAPVREVIEDGRNGLLTDFFDPEALAHCAANSLDQRSDLLGLRARARETVREKYDLHRRCLPAQLALLEGTSGVPPMAGSNSPTCGQSNSSGQDGVDYESCVVLTASREAASFSL